MTFHQTLAEWSQWIWPLVANHLWQTTVFALTAWGITRLLKRSTVRVRYFVWSIALMKFLLPSALLILALERIGVDITLTAPATGAGAEIVSRIAQPILPVVDHGAIPAAEPTAAASPVNRESHREFYCLLSLFWGLGAAAVSTRWLVRRWRFRLALRAGAEITTGREAVAFNQARSWLFTHREIKLVAVPGLRELGVWRVWRPIVLLPDGMAERLSDRELEAVMMHELVHVMRHDNLKDTWRMLLCCLFWFHPMIWLIDRELLAEREVICDEAVIRYSGDAKTYAAGLWKVAQYGLGWDFAGISRAAGSTLSRRINLMLNAEGPTNLSPFGRALAGVAICGLFIFAIAIAVFTRSDVSAAKLQARVGPVQRAPETPPESDKRAPVAAPMSSSTKPKIRAAGASEPTAKSLIDVDQDERSSLMMPVQFNNDHQTPIIVTEAVVEVSEPFDITTIFNPFSEPPRMMRDLKFTLKLVNQGNQPVTGLSLACQSPLFSNAGLRIEGKKSSLDAHESATISWGHYVDDQEYALDLISNIQLKLIAVTHGLVDPPDFGGFGFGRMKRGMLFVDVAFHDLEMSVGLNNQLPARRQ
jgi:beta-lactamase regulating signal transducer with metallopeptidase domain